MIHPLWRLGLTCARLGLKALLGFSTFAVGCDGLLHSAPEVQQDIEPKAAEPDEAMGGREAFLRPAQPKPARDAEREESESCARDWERLEALEALPGTPELEARRVELLARAPSTPVVFLKAPSETASKAAEPLRRLLLDKRWSHAALSEVLRRTRFDLALRREVFLREGYLYGDQPLAALRLAEHLRFDHLFDDRKIVVERGGETFVLERRKEIYVHPDTPARGARLLLFDRIWRVDDPPGARRHFALGQLADQLGFSSLKVVRLTDEGALVKLDYSGQTVRAVLGFAEAEAELRCEVVAPSSNDVLGFARDWGQRRRKAFAALRGAIDAMVDEALPFDEPKTEIGQQDGQLRPAWLTAYRKGDIRYEFNGDPYPIFDWQGRPRVPQVCLDFITDAFERAGGGWWAPRGEPRRRLAGTISFRNLGIENSRSVESFVNFAWKTPEWFDVVWLTRAERVPFRKRRAFFEHLAAHAERYQPGDVIVIYGLRSDDRNHYHSFFVYDSDPVSGAPTLVAANAGSPRIRSWEAEMRNAPKRSIVARLRPRLHFLETLLSSDQPLRPPRRLRWVEPDDEGPDQERDDVSGASSAGPG